MNTVIPRFVAAISKRKPKAGACRWLLLHDNANSHKAANTREFLASHGFTVLDHPPYSLDLAPCDFWLFPSSKSYLFDYHFTTPQDLARAVWANLRSFPAFDYRTAFDNWKIRLRTFVEGTTIISKD